MTDFDFTALEPGQKIPRRVEGRRVVSVITLCPVCGRPGLRLPAPTRIRWAHSLSTREHGGKRNLESYRGCSRSRLCTCNRPPPAPGVRRLVRPCPVHGKKNDE